MGRDAGNTPSCLPPSGSSGLNRESSVRRPRWSGLGRAWPGAGRVYGDSGSLGQGRGGAGGSLTSLCLVLSLWREPLRVVWVNQPALRPLIVSQKRGLFPQSRSDRSGEPRLLLTWSPGEERATTLPMEAWSGLVPPPAQSSPLVPCTSRAPLSCGVALTFSLTAAPSALPWPRPRPQVHGVGLKGRGPSRVPCTGRSCIMGAAVP